MAKSKKIIEKGLSLIEASMVLALAAVVTSAALYYFSNVRINHQVEQTSTLIVDIVTKVQTLYQNKNPEALVELKNPEAARNIVASLNKSLEFKDISDENGRIHTGFKLPSVPGVVLMYGFWADEWVHVPHFIVQFYFDSSASESFKTELCNSVLGRNWGSSFYGGQVVGVNDTITQRPKKDILSACASPDKIVGLTLAFQS